MSNPEAFQEWWYRLNQDLGDLAQPVATRQEALAHYAESKPTAYAARRIIAERSASYVDRIRMGVD